jgi:uncharacterized membrane protein YbhN (UPF0104 family)
VGPKTKRFIKTFLKFVLTALALYYVFTRIDFSNVIGLISQANIWILLVAVLLFGASKAVSAFRLNIFFEKTGLTISNSLNIKLYLLGMFYNLFLPGGIGGDGYKIYLLQKHYKTGTGKLFGAVLTDRLSGMLALVLLALFLFSTIEMSFKWNWLGYALIPVAIVGFYTFCRLFYKHFIPVLFLTLSFSLIVQALQLICVYMIILALGAGHEHMLEYLLVFLVSSIVAVLPISIGGMGVRELTFLYGAQILGIDESLAVSISLLFYIITALVSFSGLWFVVMPVRLTKQ